MTESGSQVYYDGLSQAISTLGMPGQIPLPSRRVKKKVIANTRQPMTMLRRKLSVSDFSAGQAGIKKH